jgi:hypothetical protein
LATGGAEFEAVHIERCGCLPVTEVGIRAAIYARAMTSKSFFSSGDTPVSRGGRWSILGDADEVRKSDERRKIVAALRLATNKRQPPLQS